MNASEKNEAVKVIAKHYGLCHQLFKASEELGEVQSEIARFLQNEDNTEHLAEEIADVLIMLLEITHLLGAEKTVDGYIDFKLRRQLLRMEEEE